MVCFVALCRLKLECDSSDSEESSPGTPRQVEYFDGDLELPLMS